ncbi:MAG: calcium/sodium antiporter [Dehalococcoidia bacterium]|nr:calcium/sodium antiporter [Dehalococcoidia bacterium]
MLAVLLFVAGLAGVVAGAHFLVLGSSRLAAALGVPSIVIGLTVVGIGTSTPELVVSAAAAINDQPATALGNVVGSNIANVGLILGISALIVPLVPDRTVLSREGPILIGVSVVFMLVALTDSFEWWFGAIALAGLAGFLVLSLRWSRDEPEPVVAQVEQFETETGLVKAEPHWQSGLYIAGGIALLVAGGQSMVTGAVDIADTIGIPEFVVASTLVALGTSMPELATSVVAAVRREADIAVGNIVGSNLFNLLGVLGLSAVLSPIPVDGASQRIDLPFMTGLTVVGVLFARQGFRLGRREGAALLAAYIIYIAWLVLR